MIQNIKFVKIEAFHEWCEGEWERGRERERERFKGVEIDVIGAFPSVDTVP